MGIASLQWNNVDSDGPTQQLEIPLPECRIQHGNGA